MFHQREEKKNKYFNFFFSSSGDGGGGLKKNNQIGKLPAGRGGRACVRARVFFLALLFVIISARGGKEWGGVGWGGDRFKFSFLLIPDFP
jgi:hypothetical protein